MKTNLRKGRGIVLGAISVILFSGCTMIQESEAMDTERTLAAAGFRMKLADSAEKMAHLKTLTQRKLVPQQKGDDLYYIYADAEFCKCLYAGSEQNYQQYQRLALQQRLSQERIMAAQMNENASMNWGMWGPWGGPGYY